MMTKKDKLMKLLKGIETGDPDAATVVNEDVYVQHNPRTAEGSIGLAELFARLAKTNPRVTFIRVFEDGDFAFAHNEYDFNGVEVAFEVFRFENGQAVEHWDNLQEKQLPNPSGRSMIDGQTAVTDLDRTEANRAKATRFASDVLVGGQFDLLEDLVSADVIQHDPETSDGLAAWRDALTAVRDGVRRLQFDRLHRVLTEGNFALCMIEGRKDGVHSGLYSLLRFEQGKVAEHWNTVTPIAPRSEWKNDNGKF